MPTPTQTSDLRVLSALGLDPSSRRRRRVVRVVLLVAAAAAAIALALLVRAATRPRPASYTTQPVARGDLDVTVAATGLVEPLEAVDVGAEISGRVVRVRVDFNDRVTAGQVLAELDETSLRATATQADAQVALAAAARKQAEVSLAEARRGWERARDLDARGVLPAAEADAAGWAHARAQAGLTSAVAQLEAARAAAALARANLAKVLIRSPIDGVVLVRQVEPGQTVVAALQAPVLFRLARGLERMKVVAQIDEADVGKVQAGQTATFGVAAYPERSFTARVTSVRNSPVTRESVVTYDAVLELDNPDGALRPGMTATATLVVASHRGVLLVPDAALRFRAAPETTPGARQPRVHLLSGGAPRAVDVRTGASDAGRTVVLESPGGPREGDLVIVDEAKGS